MKIFNKLVRDKIPEIIEKEGKFPKLRILSEIEYRKELLKKLIEEANEVISAQDNKEDLTKEIGDVLELIDSIIKTFNLDPQDVTDLKEKRKQERGGFDKQIFLESVE